MLNITRTCTQDLLRLGQADKPLGFPAIPKQERCLMLHSSSVLSSGSVVHDLLLLLCHSSHWYANWGALSQLHYGLSDYTGVKSLGITDLKIITDAAIEKNISGISDGDVVITPPADVSFQFAFDYTYRGQSLEVSIEISVI